MERSLPDRSCQRKNNMQEHDKYDLMRSIEILINNEYGSVSYEDVHEALEMLSKQYYNRIKYL